MDGYSFSGCMSSRLVPAVFDSLPQGLRNFQMSVPASTSFIGPAQNNFSHKSKESFCCRLSHSGPVCLEAVHMLSQDASIAVSNRCRRCFNPLHRFVSIRRSPRIRPASGTRLETQILSILNRWIQRAACKKRRQEDRPLPPPVCTTTAVALCL